MDTDFSVTFEDCAVKIHVWHSRLEAEVEYKGSYSDSNQYFSCALPSVLDTHVIVSPAFAITVNGF